MRNIRRSLRNLLQPRMRAVMQRDAQKNRERNGEKARYQTDDDCVANDRIKRIGVEQPSEVLQPYPSALGNRFAQWNVLERHRDAIHRNV